MKRLLTIMTLAVVTCFSTLTANADVYVRGYYRNNGSYVQPHYRSNPDSSFSNNWSTHPNTNPYTGKQGTRRTLPHNNGSFSPLMSHPHSWND